MQRCPTNLSLYYSQIPQSSTERCMQQLDFAPPQHRRVYLISCYEQPSTSAVSSSDISDGYNYSALRGFWPCQKGDMNLQAKVGRCWGEQRLCCVTAP